MLFQTIDLDAVEKLGIYTKQQKIILQVTLLSPTSSLLVSFSTLSLQIVIGTQLSYSDSVMETLPCRDVQTYDCLQPTDSLTLMGFLKPDTERQTFMYELKCHSFKKKQKNNVNEDWSQN